jgi:L-iditol 2-dehydrogenase
MKSMQMTALKKLEPREIPAPKIVNPHDVLVKIAAVGVCGSDVHYYRTGRVGSQVVECPFILGHEAAGTVAEVGSAVKDVRPGMRVALDPAMPCHQCDQCREGRSHTCRNLRFLACPGQASGAFAEYLVMPEECCLPAENLTPEEAAFVEPLSIGLYAWRLAAAKPNAKAVILGSGPIGLSVLLSAKAHGAGTTYMTDLLPYRLECARRSGADWIGNPRQEDVAAAVQKREPLGVDCAFECAGEQETLDQAVQMLKPGGLLVMVGIPEFERVSFSADFVRRKEIRIQNVRRQNGCAVAALELLTRIKARVNPLITHRYPLAQTQTAFDLVDKYEGGVVKAMVTL